MRTCSSGWLANRSSRTNPVPAGMCMPALQSVWCWGTVAAIPWRPTPAEPVKYGRGLSTCQPSSASITVPTTAAVSQTVLDS